LWQAALISALARQVTAAADRTDPNQLLQRAVQRIAENTRALKRLTCEEHTTRRFYLASSKENVSTAGIADVPSWQGRNLFWSDRLRVELSLFDGKNVFSWVGGGRFDSDLDGLITEGATLSGVLGPFDISVLLNDADPSRFRYEGSASALARTVAKYSYQVPVEKSHLLFPDQAGKRTTVPYQGFFLVDAAAADLLRLCIELNQFPPHTQISAGTVVSDYAVHSISDHAAFVPANSTMRLLFKQGQLAVNEMQYTNCHVFQAESTLHFGDAPQPNAAALARSIAEQLPPLPKNRLVKLALNAPLDSSTAATGDAVEARVVKSLKGKDGRTIIPAGARAHGRILRLIQYSSPYNSIELVLRFDSIESEGQTVPLRLSPPDSEIPTAKKDARSMVGTQRMPVFVVQDQTQLNRAEDDRKNGTKTFDFNQTDRLRLPAGYTTEWIIR
jgi:hypothetical protein